MSRRILIVDDDEEIRLALRMLLEDARYEVVEAPDGMAALRVLRASPDHLVVLLDNLMPGLEGMELLAQLEADGDGEPSPHAYILITASPQHVVPALAERLARLGVPVIAKPFDLDAVLAAVAAATNRLEANAGG